VAIGDSSHLRERSRVIIDKFISFIFAPVFFASVGLKVNFFAHFDFLLVLTILTIACVCKLIGGFIGARWGEMPHREAWAVGFAMNSRGAMEIILGIIALEAGIIQERLFVALIIMAMVTSMMSGPFMQMILRTGKERRIRNILSPMLKATSSRNIKKKDKTRGLDTPGVRNSRTVRRRNTLLPPWRRGRGGSPSRLYRRVSGNLIRRKV
jgi:predicted permease